MSFPGKIYIPKERNESNKNSSENQRYKVKIQKHSRRPNCPISLHYRYEIFLYSFFNPFDAIKLKNFVEEEKSEKHKGHNYQLID